MCDLDVFDNSELIQLLCVLAASLGIVLWLGAREVLRSLRGIEDAVRRK